MKICKFCGKTMIGDFETNTQNSRKYKAFYNCPNCKSVCDGEYMDKKDGTQTISERWWNPNTESFESEVK